MQNCCLQEHVHCLPNNNKKTSIAKQHSCLHNVFDEQRELLMSTVRLIINPFRENMSNHFNCELFHVDNSVLRELCSHLEISIDLMLHL